MTKDFIIQCFSQGALNVPVNAWVTLHNKVQRIGLLADNNISVDPRYRIFYFDTTNELLYITYYDGVLYRYEDGAPLENPEQYSVVNINGVNYLNKKSKNSVKYTIGGNECDIHAIISFDKIVGFYYPNVNTESILAEM